MKAASGEKKARPTNLKRQVDQASQSNNQTISDYQSHIKCKGSNIDADNVGAVVRSSVYHASTIKRHRRTGAQMADLLDAIQREIEAVESRMTIRHLFYRLATAKVIEKTESEYAKLCGHLSRWRKDGEIPFSAFTDSTRWYYGNTGFDSVEEALEDCAATYRKNVWRDSEFHVEVWVEKSTIAGLLLDAASVYGVRVFPCKGFASLSSLHDAAGYFRHYIERGKSVHILYFGDYDPSGLLVDQNVARTFYKTFNVPVNLRRIAVTRSQIEAYELPTRPTKKSKHSKGFIGESVEIDAMEPGTLKELVADSIGQYIDQRQLDVLMEAERSERNIIYGLADLQGIGGQR